MRKTLVIVESPTKAKTISKYLGNDFIVESSMGHVRDLPKSSMGVDIDNGTFKPYYEIPSGKKKIAAKLKKLAKETENILFATDEDREGEAISWHLAEILKIKPKEVKRLVFHEITRQAIKTALKNPRPLNTNLVDAQQARRILDRLVGYELSPLLWKKVRYGLSAGRVQSVAVHLIAEREKERAKFKTAEYYDLIAELEAEGRPFEARLMSHEGKQVPSGKNFDANTGKLKNPEKFILLNKAEAENLAKILSEAKPWTINAITETPYQTHPYPPFITSTLQQEASRKLGWSAKQTMRIAQSLYEKGYITYMRTDSVNLSKQAINAAREAAKEFGAEYLSEQPKLYKSKSKSAQEAHEAIRPSGSAFIHPSEAKKQIQNNEFMLYELIWKRTVACQMKSARMTRVSAKITVQNSVFEAKGKQIKFAGYLRAYVEGSDDPMAELDDQEINLPNLREKQIIKAKSVKADGHETQPPARYTEASLIKKLESEGVGRPSTYASILGTIIEREYVRKHEKALVPTFTAMIVDKYLHKHFGKLLDVKFTSKMEDDLDRIAEGKEKWQPYIKSFYGNGGEYNFHSEVEQAAKSEIYPTVKIGENIIIKSGKYGAYVQCGNGSDTRTASIPESIAPADLDEAMAMKIIEDSAKAPKVIATDEKTGKPITFRTGRYGPYLQLGEDDGAETDKNKKPEKAKKVSLTYGPKQIPLSVSIDINNISKEDALKIMSLPRHLGEIDGAPVTANIGRYGPYVKKENDYRSIPKNIDVLTVTLNQAKELFAKEKIGRRRNKAEVLKELGNDPKTNKPVRVLDGKYGPYVSNGTRTFATVPKGQKPEDVTINQAIKWIEEKRQRKRQKK